MANTAKLETPAFTLGEGTVTRERGGWRTNVIYQAPATRHIDGGFDVTVNAILLDGDRRFVARTSSGSSKCVLANRAAWVHEFEHDRLAAGRHLVYEIQHKVDYRRKLLGGELPELPAEADGSEYWRLLQLDPRALEDRIVRLEIALWARQSSLDITYSQSAKLPTDSLRSEFELDLLDGDRNVCFTRNFSASLNYGQPSFEDTSLQMDRKTLRTLRFFELRARTECRALARLAVDDY